MSKQINSNQGQIGGGARKEIRQSEDQQDVEAGVDGVFMERHCDDMTFGRRLERCLSYISLEKKHFPK